MSAAQVVMCDNSRQQLLPPPIELGDMKFAAMESGNGGEGPRGSHAAMAVSVGGSRFPHPRFDGMSEASDRRSHEEDMSSGFVPSQSCSSTEFAFSRVDANTASLKTSEPKQYRQPHHQLQGHSNIDPPEPNGQHQGRPFSDISYGSNRAATTSHPSRTRSESALSPDRVLSVPFFASLPFGTHTRPLTTHTSTISASSFSTTIHTNDFTTVPSTDLQPDTCSADETLSRETMGYSNTTVRHQPISDTAPSAKMHGTERGESETGNHTTASRGHTGDDDDSTSRSTRSVDSAGSQTLTPQQGSAIPNPDNVASLSGRASLIGTPSTVSTAPSTDDASLCIDFQQHLQHCLIPAASADGMRNVNASSDALNRYHHHQRVPSWEPTPHQTLQLYEPEQLQSVLPPAFASQSHGSGPWGFAQNQQQHGQQQQMVASFREQHGFPPMGPRYQGDHQHQQHHQQQTYYPGRHSDARSKWLGQQQTHTSPPASFNQYQLQQRKPAFNSVASAGVTPPRTARGHAHQRAMPNSPHRPQQLATTGNPSSRSPSEVLKTLLRKKACLYEPDTSRAVALVTWLVGRVLAINTGFFSRQQLQAGVHACVAEKIQSGVITRTKVNRCMQIILNSCFHYIIPRPDGTEENGDGFRKQFSGEVSDDTFLLELLPVPWNDVIVETDVVLDAASAEAECKHPKKAAAAVAYDTPQSSPRFGSTPSPDKGSPGKESLDGEDCDAKRAVLLCFNENVRRAEDVFRCHNEFIRDTAHASNLQLSSQEWRLFFGKDAAEVPLLWGNIGIPVPYVDGHAGADALGMLTRDECKVFRTTWCAKRYDHDHELCGFAHVEVNGGWLRRNPSTHRYRDEMCPYISTFPDKRGGHAMYVINECPHGVNCEYAHSVEEIAYHPRRYKTKNCVSMARPGGCPLGDVCPHFHAADSYRFPKKVEGRSPRHSRQQQHQMNKSAGPAPAGAPTVYASPAPLSNFEKHLHLPGLQNLFRRQCSVARANLNHENCACRYSYFGDDTGIPCGKRRKSGVART